MHACSAFISNANESYHSNLICIFRRSHITCNKDLAGSLATCSILELDREKVESIEMLLVASDHGSPSRTAAISKTVRVMGVNDNSPYFQELVQNVTVIEGVAKHNIYTVHVRIYN